MDILFCLLVVLIFVLFFHKQISKIIKKDENIPYVALHEHIETLSELKKNLNDVEQMITDVQICTPRERATAFKLYMHSNNSAVNIIADNASENILVLLEDERKKLRSALYHEVKKLSYRCNFDSNANDNFFNKIQ